MPTINLNKKVFENLVGKKLPEEQLKDRISMLGTDLEAVNQNEIVVEVFPNRPDMLSEQGFARAFSSFIGIKPGLRKYTVIKTSNRVIIEPSVNNIRPYTACAVVKNLQFNDEKIKEIIQIQEKLHTTYGRNRKKCAIGVYPLEKIKFPIRYLAEDPNKIKFQPLESKREMTGLQILSQHPAGRDYGHLLEGLEKFPIFIDANDQILSMPPVINSHIVGKISETTQEVFIECSGFDYLFLKKSLNIIVTALADMGGQIYSLELHYPRTTYISPDLEPEEMKISLNYVNQILGLDLDEKHLQKYLEAMGYGYKNKKTLVPAYRADILHQIDLVEDIAIAYGYENFEPEIPQVATIAQEDSFQNFLNKIRNLLIGFQLQETKTYHLMTKDELNKKMNLDYPPIPLRNSLGDYNHLRNWLIPSGLKVLSENQHHDYPQNIFEIGTVFTKDKENKTETGVQEFQRVSIFLCHEKTDFTEIKQILDTFFQTLNLQYQIKDTEHPSFIPGRVGRISCQKKEIAYIGELSPEVLTNWGLVMPVTALEINLTELYALLENELK